jgi:hypothetical protein
LYLGCDVVRIVVMQESNDSNHHLPEPPPVGVKEAVQKALIYLRELYSYSDTPLPNLRLEEVEMSEDGTQWLVTYGFTAAEQDIERNSIFSGLGGTTTRTRRDYKVIAVDARTGEALSMKIREL